MNIEQVMNYVMSSDYEKICDLLAETAGKDKVPLEELVQLIFEFTDRYQKVMENGSEEEKSKIAHQMDDVRSRIQEQLAQKEEDIALTKEELKALGEDPKHFTEDQWEALEKARAEIARYKRSHDLKKKGGSKKKGHHSRWTKG